MNYLREKIGRGGWESEQGGATLIATFIFAVKNQSKPLFKDKEMNPPMTQNAMASVCLEMVFL